MPATNCPNTRAFYRLKFPERERPTLVIAGVSFRVIDLSEGGCRFYSANCSLQPNQAFEGTLLLRDGSRQSVTGAILRRADQMVQVRFTIGLDQHTMVALQRDIARRYPWFEEVNHSGGDG